MRTIEPPLGGRTLVRGRALWTHRAGAGTPAVVFAGGGGAFGLDYLMAHDRVAAFTTAVLFDRAGTGWSDPVELPRSATAVADELWELLDATGVPAPFVLVGHSLGALHARRFAQLHPGAVAGLVLLDPAHEDWDAYQPPQLRLTRDRGGEPQTPEITDELLAQVRAVFEQLLAPLPEAVRGPLTEQHMRPESLLTGFQEGGNLAELFDELRRDPDPDVPTAIIGATGIDAGQTLFMPADVLRVQIEGAQRLYRDVVARLPRGSYRVVADASHSSLPFARPDVVADAVRDVVARAAG